MSTFVVSIDVVADAEQAKPPSQGARLMHRQGYEGECTGATRESAPPVCTWTASLSILRVVRQTTCRLLRATSGENALPLSQ